MFQLWQKYGIGQPKHKISWWVLSSTFFLFLITTPNSIEKSPALWISLFPVELWAYKSLSGTMDNVMKLQSSLSAISWSVHNAQGISFKLQFSMLQKWQMEMGTKLNGSGQQSCKCHFDWNYQVCQNPPKLRKPTCVIWKDVPVLFFPKSRKKRLDKQA